MGHVASVRNHCTIIDPTCPSSGAGRRYFGRLAALEVSFWLGNHISLLTISLFRREAAVFTSFLLSRDRAACYIRWLSTSAVLSSFESRFLRIVAGLPRCASERPHGCAERRINHIPERVPRVEASSVRGCRGEALDWQCYISTISLFLEKQRYYPLPSVAKQNCMLSKLLYFDRAVPLSFETRFLRIVGVALDAQPARPAQ